MKAVHSIDSSAIFTCQNPAFKLNFDKYLHPYILFIHSCLFGILYPSSIVLSFSLL
jgi:hypothetical protein